MMMASVSGTKQPGLESGRQNRYKNTVRCSLPIGFISLVIDGFDIESVILLKSEQTMKRI